MVLSSYTVQLNLVRKIHTGNSIAVDAHTHCYSVQVDLSVYIYVEQSVRKRDTKFATVQQLKSVILVCIQNLSHFPIMNIE